MKKIIKGLKHRWLAMTMMCLISLGTLSITGCAGRTETSTVTTQTTSDGTLGSGSTTSVTTQKDTVISAHPRGIVGGFFYTLGQVIIFPFRVIGNLFT